MAKYHVKGDGTLGPCSAATGNCPFSADGAEHFSNVKEARAASELILAEAAGGTLVTASHTKAIYERLEEENGFPSGLGGLREDWVAGLKRGQSEIGHPTLKWLSSESAKKEFSDGRVASVLTSVISQGPSGVTYAANGSDRAGWVLSYYKSGVKLHEPTRHARLFEAERAAENFEASRVTEPPKDVS
jgi:hypothetical protein